MVGALRGGRGFVGATRAVLLGAGSTATAALVGLASVGVEFSLVVRSAARAVEAVECAAQVGVPLEAVTWAQADLAALASACAVLVSTVPQAATELVAADLAEAPCLLDVIYHPWPTPLALTAQKHDRPLATGLDMLLNQAFGQSEQFTGRPAPREAMRDALREPTGGVLPLPV